MAAVEPPPLAALGSGGSPPVWCGASEQLAHALGGSRFIVLRRFAHATPEPFSRCYSQHSGPVGALAAASTVEGLDVVASAAEDDGMVHVWSAATLESLRVLAPTEERSSPHARVQTLCSLVGDVRDTAAHRRQRSASGVLIRCLEFSSQGSRLLSVESRAHTLRLVLWLWAQGECLAVINASELPRDIGLAGFLAQPEGVSDETGTFAVYAVSKARISVWCVDESVPTDASLSSLHGLRHVTQAHSEIPCEASAVSSLACDGAAVLVVGCTDGYLRMMDVRAFIPTSRRDDGLTGPVVEANPMKGGIRFARSSRRSARRLTRGTDASPRTSSSAGGQLTALELGDGSSDPAVSPIALLGGTPGHVDRAQHAHSGAVLSIAARHGCHAAIASAGVDGRIRLWTSVLQPVLVLNLSAFAAAALDSAGRQPRAGGGIWPPLVRVLKWVPSETDHHSERPDRTFSASGDANMFAGDSPDAGAREKGRLLAATGGETLLLDVSTGAWSVLSQGHDPFSPSVSGHAFGRGGFTSDRPEYSHRLPPPLIAAAQFSPLLASSGADLTVRVWHTSLRSQVAARTIPDVPTALAWDTSETHLLVATRSGHVFWLRTPDMLTVSRLVLPRSIDGADYATVLAPSPFGGSVAVGTARGAVMINLPGDSLRGCSPNFAENGSLTPLGAATNRSGATMEASEFRVTAIDWSADGRAIRAFATSTAGTQRLALWRAHDGVRLMHALCGLGSDHIEEVGPTDLHQLDVDVEEHGSQAEPTLLTKFGGLKRTRGASRVPDASAAAAARLRASAEAAREREGAVTALLDSYGAWASEDVLGRVDVESVPRLPNGARVLAVERRRIRDGRSVDAGLAALQCSDGSLLVLPCFPSQRLARTAVASSTLPYSSAGTLCHIRLGPSAGGTTARVCLSPRGELLFSSHEGGAILLHAVQPLPPPPLPSPPALPPLPDYYALAMGGVSTTLLVDPIYESPAHMAASFANTTNPLLQSTRRLSSHHEHIAGTALVPMLPNHQAPPTESEVVSYAPPIDGWEAAEEVLEMLNPPPPPAAVVCRDGEAVLALGALVLVLASPASADSRRGYHEGGGASRGDSHVAPMRIYRGHTSTISAIAAHPTAPIIASAQEAPGMGEAIAGAPGLGGHIRVWSRTTLSTLSVIGPDLCPPRRLGFDEGGEMLFAVLFRGGGPLGEPSLGATTPSATVGGTGSNIAAGIASDALAVWAWRRGTRCPPGSALRGDDATLAVSVGRPLGWAPIHERGLPAFSACFVSEANGGFVSEANGGFGGSGPARGATCGEGPLASAMPASAQPAMQGRVRMCTCGPGSVRFWVLAHAPPPATTGKTATAAADDVHGSNVYLESDPMPIDCRVIFLCCTSLAGFTFVGTSSGEIYQFQSTSSRHAFSLSRRIHAHRGPVCAITPMYPSGARRRPANHIASLATDFMGAEIGTPPLERAELASAGGDGKLRLWACAGEALCSLALLPSLGTAKDEIGRPLPRGATPLRVTGLSSAADGSFFATAGRSVVRLSMPTPRGSGAAGVTDGESASRYAAVAGVELLFHATDAVPRRSEVYAFAWRGMKLSCAPITFCQLQQSGDVAAVASAGIPHISVGRSRTTALLGAPTLVDTCKNETSCRGLPDKTSPAAEAHPCVVARSANLTWGAVRG